LKDIQPNKSIKNKSFNKKIKDKKDYLKLIKKENEFHKIHKNMDQLDNRFLHNKYNQIGRNQY